MLLKKIKLFSCTLLILTVSNPIQSYGGFFSSKPFSILSNPLFTENQIIQIFEQTADIREKNPHRFIPALIEAQGGDTVSKVLKSSFFDSNMDFGDENFSQNQKKLQEKIQQYHQELVQFGLEISEDEFHQILANMITSTRDSALADSAATLNRHTQQSNRLIEALSIVHKAHQQEIETTQKNNQEHLLHLKKKKQKVRESVNTQDYISYNDGFIKKTKEMNSYLDHMTHYIIQNKQARQRAMTFALKTKERTPQESRIKFKAYMKRTPFKAPYLTPAEEIYSRVPHIIEKTKTLETTLLAPLQAWLELDKKEHSLFEKALETLLNVEVTAQFLEKVIQMGPEPRTPVQQSPEPDQNQEEVTNESEELETTSENIQVVVQSGSLLPFHTSSSSSNDSIEPITTPRIAHQQEKKKLKDPQPTAPPQFQEASTTLMDQMRLMDLKKQGQEWTVHYNQHVIDATDPHVEALIQELSVTGPLLRDWPNFKAMRGSDTLVYHCHLRNDFGTVALWSMQDKKIELLYVGKREKGYALVIKKQKAREASKKLLKQLE